MSTKTRINTIEEWINSSEPTDAICIVGQAHVNFLLGTLKEAIGVIVNLQISEKPCWCPVAIGNPMLKGQHTEWCKRAQNFLKEFQE